MGFQMATISGGTLKFTGAPAATNKTLPIIDFSVGVEKEEEEEQNGI